MNFSQITNSSYTFSYGLKPVNHEIIAQYGILPEIESKEEKEKWFLFLSELNKNLTENMVSSYMYPAGQVLTYGYNSNGYFVIVFEKTTISQESIDELYSFVDEKAINMSVQDVPVEFCRGTYWYNLTTAENLNESEILAIQEYMKSGKDIWYWNLYANEIVIARYGELPLYTDESSRSDFGIKLQEIIDDSYPEMESYMNNGQVISYGIRYGPSIDVGININETGDAQLLCADIYQIFNEAAIQKGITNLPVIFVEASVIVPDDALIEENDSDEYPNSNETKTEDKSSRKVPGLGFLGVLFVMYGGFFITKRK